MRITTVPGLILTAALLGGGARAHAQSHERVDHVFAKYNRLTSPGCALGVVQDGHLVYTHGYGSEDLDYGLPLSDSSVFYMASVSKQFAAASVALAAHVGKLSLDDDIRKWIPELPNYGTTITVRELVHHTSGIRDYLGLMQLAGMRWQDTYTDAEIIDLISRQKGLNFPPGTQYAYSNSGYFLLSVIMQRATGQPLSQFADEHIFKPLGMTHTHFHDNALIVVRNRAVGYDRAGDHFTLDHLWNFDKVGDGGLYSSVHDLFLWDQNFYHDKLGGGPGFIDSITTPDVLPNGTHTGYAFGNMAADYRGIKTVEHGGALAGFRTEIMRFPSLNFSVIILCNISEADPAGFAHAVADVYLGTRLAATPPVDTSTTASADDLASMAGTYWNPSEGDILEVSTSGHTAAIAFGTQKVPLHPAGAHMYRIGPDASSEYIFAPGTLKIVRKNAPEETLQAVTFQHPSAADLAAYTGAFHNDELQATYTVKVDGDHLTVQTRVSGPIALTSPDHDVFVGRPAAMAPVTLRFTRDGSGAVTGYTLGSGRVKDIQFRKT
jgi:CubicO group peptidase (beta-lactamase class C family)